MEGVGNVFLLRFVDMAMAVSAVLRTGPARLLNLHSLVFLPQTILEC